MNLEWVALNACTEWDPKAVKFLAVVPKKTNNDININGAFFF